MVGAAVADEADDVGEGGVVAESEGFVAFDAVGLADGGEHFGLLDGVDAEVGFEVEVEVQQVRGVAGLFGHHGEHRCLHVVARWVGDRRLGRRRGRRRGLGRGALG